MRIINPFAALVVGVLTTVGNSLKTLVVSNFPDQKDAELFKRYIGEDLLRSDGVIFIENSGNLLQLSHDIKPHQHTFDRVVVSSHGFMGEIPTMGFKGQESVPITQVITTMNQGSKNLKKIHLASCFIGSNFDKITDQRNSDIYYQELQKSLRDNQVLFLHGDGYIGLVGASYDARMRGIIENKNYSILQTMTDSGEAIIVAIKKHHNLRANALQAFVPKLFGRSGEKYTTENLVKYLNQVSKAAKDFEVEQNILGEDVVRPQVSDFDEGKLSEYLGKRHGFDMRKMIDSRNYVAVRDLLAHEIDPNFQDAEGATTLMKSVIKDDHEIVELLLRHEGIDLDITDRFGRSALMFAIKNGNWEITKTLIDHGAALHIPDKYGGNILFYAYTFVDEAGGEKIVKGLLKK